MGYRRRNRSYRGGGPNFLGLIILLCAGTFTWFTNASKTAKYLAILIVLLFVSLMIYLFVRKHKKNHTMPNGNNNEILVTSNTARTVDNYEERPLLTETESKFYEYLSNALEGYDVVINTKTRLEDLAKVRANTRSEYMRARGYIKSRHIDFILCDKAMNVICGIEVDDDSHLDPKAKEIDKFKDDLFTKINKTLFRVNNLNKLKESAEYIVEALNRDNKINKTTTNKQNVTASVKEETEVKQEMTPEQVNDLFFSYLTKELDGKGLIVHRNIKLWNLANAKDEARTIYLRSSENARSSVVDFVICGKDMEILCGVDVNDSSFTTLDEKERNELKDKVFKTINKQLYRVIYLDKLEESAKYIVKDLVQNNKII